jgi:hypothetical protein
MTTSLPARLLAKTFTLPVRMMYNESFWSPSLISTVFFGNWRTTPDAAMACNVSGASVAEGAEEAGMAVAYKEC